MSLSMIGNILGLVGAASSAGSGIASLFGGGGGNKSPQFNVIDPFSQLIAHLLGGYMGTNKNMPAFEPHRPDKFGNYPNDYDTKFSTSIFANQKQNIADLMRPLPLNPMEQQARDLASFAMSGRLPMGQPSQLAGQPQMGPFLGPQGAPAPQIAANMAQQMMQPPQVGSSAAALLRPRGVPSRRQPVRHPVQQPVTQQPVAPVVPVAPMVPQGPTAAPPVPVAPPADNLGFLPGMHSDTTANGQPVNAYDRVMNTIRQFEDFLMPTAKDLVETGFRTDMQPIIEAANRRFQRDTIPELTERFLGQTGTFSSDFLNSQVEAGRDIQANLGAIQAELDEAAAQRRASAIPMYGQLAAMTQDLPLGISRDLLSLGGLFRQQDEAMRPGSRTLDILERLSGMSDPHRFGIIGQGGMPSNTAMLASSLAGAAPGFVAAGNLLGGLSGLFGGGGGSKTQGGNAPFFG